MMFKISSFPLVIWFFSSIEFGTFHRVTCQYCLFFFFSDQDLLEEILLDSCVYPCQSIVSELFCEEINSVFSELMKSVFF